jgi:GTP-binding protein HflX
LFEIDKNEKPTIIVFNKIDAFSYTPKEEDDLTPETRKNISLEELKKTWMSKLKEDCIFISAKEGDNIDELKKLIYDKAKEVHITRFPYNDFLFYDYEEESNQFDESQNNEIDE